MTRDTILALEGRGLDVAVHKSIFNCMGHPLERCFDGSPWPDIVPEYSNTWQGADLVIGAMQRRWKKQGWGWYWAFIDLSPDSGWRVLVNDDLRVVIRVEADTLPAAVCKAALLAVKEADDDATE